jgi:hypothetical protein
MPDWEQRELVATDAAEVALLARMGVTVFDDADGAALRTLQTVHASLNTRHAQKSTTARRIDLTVRAYQAILKKSRRPSGCFSFAFGKSGGARR